MHADTVMCAWDQFDITAIDQINWNANINIKQRQSSHSEDMEREGQRT